MTSSSKSSMDIGMALAAIGGIVVSFIVLIAVSIVLNGWVLSFLWKWFISDIFGIQALTVGQAIGVSMTVSFLTYRASTSKTKGSEFDWSAIIGQALISPFITLAIAALVKTFI